MSAPETIPAETIWRVGNHYGIHVYEGDRPVATFHRAEDAERAVAAMNAQRPTATGDREMLRDKLRDMHRRAQRAESGLERVRFWTDQWELHKAGFSERRILDGMALHYVEWIIASLNRSRASQTTPPPDDRAARLAAADIVRTIAHRMTALRTARRLSLQEVADSAGLTKSHIWELEKGRTSNPTVTTVVALARAFGVSIDYLTGLSSDQPAIHPEALRIACDIDRLLREERS